MPSLSQATPAQWARMRASTSMSSYGLMDGLRGSPVHKDAVKPHLLAALPDLLLGEWVSEDADGMLSLTEKGLKHLRD